MFHVLLLLVASSLAAKHKCVYKGCPKIVPRANWLCGTHNNSHHIARVSQGYRDMPGFIGRSALCAAKDTCTHTLNSKGTEVRAAFRGKPGNYCSQGCRAVHVPLEQKGPSCTAYSLAQALVIARQRSPRSAQMTEAVDVARLAEQLWSTHPNNTGKNSGNAGDSRFSSVDEWRSAEAAKFGMEVEQIGTEWTHATPAAIAEALSLLNNNVDIVLMSVGCMSESRFYEVFGQKTEHVTEAHWAQAKGGEIVRGERMAGHSMLCLNQENSGGHGRDGFMVKNSWGGNVHHHGKIFVDADVVRQNPGKFGFLVIRPISS